MTWVKFLSSVLVLLLLLLELLLELLLVMLLMMTMLRMTLLPKQQLLCAVASLRYAGAAPAAH
jgi:hypothetical protein